MASKSKVIASEKEPFFLFSKEALRRPGVILRLLSIAVAIVGIVLSIALPTVTIGYATYSQSSTFSSVRASAWVNELVSGSNAMFGGDYFYYYLKIKDGPTVLYTTLAKANWPLIAFMIVAVLTMALVVMITFSKKMEKVSKLATLLYFVCGLAVLASPVLFMVTNSFGNTSAVAANNAFSYFLYDSLYVHDAYGAIVGFGVFTAAAVLFGIGTSLEMGGGDNRNNQE